MLWDLNCLKLTNVNKYYSDILFPICRCTTIYMDCQKYLPHFKMHANVQNIIPKLQLKKIIIIHILYNIN